MTKVYDSEEDNRDDAVPETGRKGGSTAGVLSEEPTPQRMNDYTGATSERSRARYFFPVVVVLLLLGWFLFVKSRYSPTTRGADTTSGAMNRSGTQMQGGSTGANTQTGP